MRKTCDTRKTRKNRKTGAPVVSVSAESLGQRRHRLRSPNLRRSARRLGGAAAAAAGAYLVPQPVPLIKPEDNASVARMTAALAVSATLLLAPFHFM